MPLVEFARRGSADPASGAILDRPKRVSVHRFYPAPEQASFPPWRGDAEMNFEAWRERVIACAIAQSQRTGEPQDRYEQTLAELYWLMRDAPSEVTQAYRLLDEEALENESRARTATLMGRSSVPAWTPAATVNPTELTRAIAMEARAVDAALFAVRSPERPADPNVDWLAPGEPATLVIPRAREPAPLGKDGRGRSWSRRGIRAHRIIPKEIGGLGVELHDPGCTGPGRDGDPARLGAALFERVDLEIETSQGGKRFRVTGLKALDQLAKQFDVQLGQLCLPDPEDGLGCLSVVWPELVMPPELVERLKDELGAQGLADDPGVAPGIVLAGSWHVPVSGGFGNVTPVLSGQGKELFPYQKTTRFELKPPSQTEDPKGPESPGLHEDIELGRSLPILVYGDILIAFAICLDFCDASADPPYHDMAVDLVLVPSYGNDNTMKSHIQTANVVKARHGARSFVVQQAYPALEGGGGYVLPAPARPNAFEVGGCVERMGWRTHRLLLR